jgi:NADH-quinone oxidoreductase subunit E
MPRLTDENVAIAHDILSRYPVAKSALIPLCHLAQEQDGWLSDEAMAHIAELTGVSAAEVLGTASFYEMFKRHPTGRYLVNICTSISCFLMGADELLAHAEERLGVRAGGTTVDNLFTLESYECQAACTEAPCLQVNYRFFYKVTPADFDELVDDLAERGLDREVPPHGTLARVRQRLDPTRRNGNVDPKDNRQPQWIANGRAVLDDGGPTPPPLPPPPEPQKGPGG